MATGFKVLGGLPGIRFSGMLATPDEIDRYEVYDVVNPTTQNSWIGTAASTAGGGLALTFGFLSKIADYPRNIRVVATTGSGTAISGTVTVVGKNQFNVLGTEVITPLGTTTAVGVGTSVFAQITSVSVAQATITGDVGTFSVGLGTGGTTTLFGLPFKLGSTADVSLYRWQSNGTSVAVNKGTIGAFVDTTTHSIKAATDIGGTSGLQVWVKPTYNAENDANPMASLTLLT